MRLDATRIADGKRVFLKRVFTADHPYEASFGRLFSNEPNASDESNYCVPVYDVLDIPDNENFIIIVMPFLDPWNRPPFETVGEAVEFFRQIFDVIILIVMILARELTMSFCRASNSCTVSRWRTSKAPLGFTVKDT